AGGIEDYQKAIELDPEDFISLNNLGMLEEKMGYKDKAKEYYKKADELTGYDPEEKKEIQEASEVPKPAAEEKPKSLTDIVKSTFTQKDTFKEFMEFVKKGFKI
ncbi:MAG: tetratricopeptide repeat protein, partial [Bacteroidetes bacterium]|nr:tetratricopeptide repeat protein [Bacteroidota bacterium]